MAAASWTTAHEHLIEPSKEDLERGVFERFIATQVGFAGSCWNYASDDDRPDFVWPQGCIGIELGEWLHKEQTSKSVQTARYEDEINRAAQQRGLTLFLKSFGLSDVDRYTVLLIPTELPLRKERPAAINALLSFLESVPRPSSEFESRHGKRFGRDDLPKELQPFFSFVSIHIAPHGSLGIQINRAASFDPEDSYVALQKLLDDKLVQKRSLYEEAKQSKGLTVLWLVVHYGRAFGINSPFEGIGIRQGLGADAATSLQIVVNRAHDSIERAAGQPFDRIVLFWDFSPRPLCFELWPGVAAVSFDRA